MTPSQSIVTTKIQDTVLAYFRKYMKKNGEPPTLRQAAEDLGYKRPSSVHTNLLTLEKKGLMKRTRGIWYIVDNKNE